jgi:hypothetical protein
MVVGALELYYRALSASPSFASATEALTTFLPSSSSSSLPPQLSSASINSPPESPATLSDPSDPNNKDTNISSIHLHAIHKTLGILVCPSFLSFFHLLSSLWLLFILSLCCVGKRI